MFWCCRELSAVANLASLLLLSRQSFLCAIAASYQTERAALSSVTFRSRSDPNSSWFDRSSFIPAQNTYTNADKLLEAAEQLAQTGECDPEEIYQAAHQLEDRIQDFVRRVEQRKVLLDMSVAFHTHVKEVGIDPQGTRTGFNLSVFM